MKKYHIVRNSKKKVTEGGAAREKAFIDFLEDYKTIGFGKNRLLDIIRILFFMFFVKESKLLLHYPSFGVPMHFRILRFMYKIVLLKCSKNNKIIIDVHDLPYEQAIDLEIKRRDYYLPIEKEIFYLNATFLFASYSMRDYIVDKYGVDPENTRVVLNGGILRDNSSTKYEFIANDKLNIVYAGTLNKGRQIDKILEIFGGLENVNLVLMGKDGEWLSTMTYKNIVYLGAKDEKEAHKIASFCDIGLIPYNQDRAYYNIAFPTKLSFYITAGISFLSTEVREVERIKNEFEIGYTLKIDDWKEFISKIKKEDIEIEKNKIEKICSLFTWNSILKEIKEIV